MQVSKQDEFGENQYYRKPIIEKPYQNPRFISEKRKAEKGVWITESDPCSRDLLSP